MSTHPLPLFARLDLCLASSHVINLDIQMQQGLALQEVSQPRYLSFLALAYYYRHQKVK